MHLLAAPPPRRSGACSTHGPAQALCDSSNSHPPMPRVTARSTRASPSCTPCLSWAWQQPPLTRRVRPQQRCSILPAAGAPGGSPGSWQAHATSAVTIRTARLQAAASPAVAACCGVPPGCFCKLQAAPPTPPTPPPPLHSLMPVAAAQGTRESDRHPAEVRPHRRRLHTLRAGPPGYPAGAAV